MASVKTTPTSDIATQEYEDFIHEGQPFGKVHWLRTESGGEGMLYAGLWTHEPATLPYVFPGDETMHVLEGAATIELEGGETVDLRPGTVASFAKGSVSTWTITQPFKKFFVISG